MRGVRVILLPARLVRNTPVIHSNRELFTVSVDIQPVRNVVLGMSLLRYDRVLWTIGAPSRATMMVMSLRKDARWEGRSIAHE